MADFYIKIDSDNKLIGLPEGKNALAANLPEHDFTNPPSGYVEMEMTAPPDISFQPYKTYDTTTSSFTGESYDYIYDSSTNKAKQVWYTRDLTTAEKTAKQNEVKDQWAKVGFSSWTWDEDLCGFKPPVEEPNDSNNKEGSKIYQWNEVTQRWDQIMGDL